MHRSGTSAMAGTLNQLGISIGKSIMPPKPDNPKGFFENLLVQQLNDDLLAQLNSSWDDFMPISNKWHKQIDISEFRQQALAIIRDEYEIENLFLIKDPRMSIVFPFWESIFHELSIDVKVIIMLRPLDEIERSLKQRNQFSFLKSRLLSMKYLLSAVDVTKKSDRTFIEYAVLLENPQRIIFNVVKKFSLEKSLNGGYFENDKAKFVDLSLRNNFSIINEEEISSKFYHSYLSYVSDDVGEKEDVLKRLESLYISELGKAKSIKTPSSFASQIIRFLPFLKSFKSNN